MDLRDYPRPKGDTGIGVHWSAGFPSVIGLTQIQDYWIPELIAMGVKWVKIAQHDGGLDFAKMLLAHDIMPIVRLYRPQPNPGTLDEKALRWVRDYVSAGIPYFEFNNEPNLGMEWQNHSMPADAPKIVASNAIVDIEAILALGGYPGIPAVSVGCQWDLVGEICRLGRSDLLKEPIWVALHNYSVNHPPDYPYDAVNQEGAPVSEEYYRELASEQWDGDAWGGWSLERVNQERRDHSNPGATAFDDASCWRGYERFDALVRKQVGRSLPILATENGYLVGEHADPRYPATSPKLHASQTLESCRSLMGTSTVHSPAPDYYFCSAFWLLGNYTLGHWAPEWEGHAWYSTRWTGGQLPIVEALKEEPKRARIWRGDAGVGGSISGTVKNGPDVTLDLARTDGWSTSTQADEAGAYAFADVPLNQYLLSVAEAEFKQAIELTEEHPQAVVNIDLTGVTIRYEHSVLRGTVQGGAGRAIQLAHLEEDWSEQQEIGADGSYRFENLPAGTYLLLVAQTDVARAGIILDGRHEMIVDLIVPGWSWAVQDGGASPGFGIVRCRVTGVADLAVHLWTSGWSGMTQQTGQKAEYGPDVCEFAPLGAGRYFLEPEGLDTQAEVQVDGSRILWVTFTQTVSQSARQSVISGKVKNGTGRTLTLQGPDVGRSTTVGDDESYRFDNLPAGLYVLEITGTQISRDCIVLDGQNQIVIDLEIPVSQLGAIFGQVTNGIGRLVRLRRPPAADPLQEVRVANDSSYRFECLTAGTYVVQVMESDLTRGVALERTDIRLLEDGQAQVDFVLPSEESIVRFLVEDTGAGYGFSVVRCQVLNSPGMNVHLWTPGWSGITQRTGSKSEYGPDVCEFAPLGAGLYFVEPEGLDVRAVVDLSKNRLAWVRFFPPVAGQRGPIGHGECALAGDVPDGEGLVVTLLGPSGGRRTIVEEGRYAFEGIAPGEYRLSLSLPGDGFPELWAREEIRLESTDRLQVDLALPESLPAESLIAGYVKGGAGRMVILRGAGIERTTPVTGEGTYGFTGLRPGVYRVIVDDSNPPSGLRPSSPPLSLDGKGGVRQDFDLEQLALPAKTIDHYVLIGNMARTKEDFLSTLQFVARFRPVVGTDLEQARRARRVTILGGTKAISESDEQYLRKSHCEVERIAGDFAKGLEQANPADSAETAPQASQAE